MLQKRLLTLVLASAIMSAAVPKAGALESAEVNIWLSTVNSTDTGMDKALSNEDSVYFVADNGERISNLIIVDESKEYQVIDGFGGSITEASAHLYQDVLDSDEQDDVMNALFDVETGIGISMLRQTIGASDHCVAPYNFAPEQQDDSLPYFDFSHELEEIFPTVQDALNVEPGRIKVMASCWSPPGWMKTNGSELGMYNNIKGTLLRSKYQAYECFILGKHTARNGVAGISPPRREFQKC